MELIWNAFRNYIETLSSNSDGASLGRWRQDNCLCLSVQLSFIPEKNKYVPYKGILSNCLFFENESKIFRMQIKTTLSYFLFHQLAGLVVIWMLLVKFYDIFCTLYGELYLYYFFNLNFFLKFSGDSAN